MGKLQTITSHLLALFRDSPSFLPRQCLWLCGNTFPPPIPCPLSFRAHLVYFVWLHPATGTGLPFGLLATPLPLPTIVLFFMWLYAATSHCASCCCMCVCVCVCVGVCVGVGVGVGVASCSPVLLLFLCPFFTLLHFEDYCTMQFIFIVRF